VIKLYVALEADLEEVDASRHSAPNRLTQLTTPAPAHSAHSAHSPAPPSQAVAEP